MLTKILNFSILAGCSDCEPGKFCMSTGLTAPEGNCSAGYICLSRSNTSMPTDGVMGFICPPGQFCLSGATACKYRIYPAIRRGFCPSRMTSSN